ncbi:MAG: dipeptide/oligopeptide/nickel ABC transporter ATP-binding protein [Chloroflexi bacterium]|nr:MAG: dipeptide/oligopeptide/nickel ABC transporter ATP-binding protein [Chloroflexota bacterium]
MMKPQDDLLLEIKNLKTHFFLQEGIVRAVDGVNLQIARGQTLGVIGESGCGKSVTAQSILRIVPSPPAKIVDGAILYYQRPANGASTEVIDLTQLDPQGKEIRAIRGGKISMIFQEPMTSFGPMHTIGNQIMEAILLHQPLSRPQAQELAIDLLQRVGISGATRTVDAYPHQLSGGMRQRAMIAMALSCNPDLLIADEPTTALDVTIQAQILELLTRLQNELNMAILFITHNLGVIAEIAHTVAVMYMGRVMEQGSVGRIFSNPLHPYTRGLLSSIPHIDGPKQRRLTAIEGVVPDPYDPPPGCPFCDRCPNFMVGVCDQAMPALVEQDPDHAVRCFLYSAATEADGAATLPVAPAQPTPLTSRREVHHDG